MQIASLRAKISQLGFTMIELLIVIAILGILAVAVLSAINPVEQINRGRDTGSRSDAEQLLSAIDRFQAFQGYFPWQVNATDTGALGVTWDSWDASWEDTSSNNCPVHEKLSVSSDPNCVSSQELKSTFFTRVFSATTNPLYIYRSTDPGSSTYICFAPQSDAYASEAVTKLDANANGQIDTTEVPFDYPAEAVNNLTECGPKGNCVCLP